MIKPIISVYGFNRLKNKFEEIKKQNRIIKNWDFHDLKKIEDNEEMIIKDINDYHAKFLKSGRNKSYYYSKYNPKNFVLNLPNLVFNRVFKFEDEEEVKLREYLNNARDKDKEKNEDSNDKYNIKIINEDLNNNSEPKINKVNSRFNSISKIEKNKN